MNNIVKSLSSEYSEDVARLKAEIPVLSSMRMSDAEVEILYRAFSHTYAAGWLTLGEEFITEFRQWLED
jgi:hypothetical protein